MAPGKRKLESGSHGNASSGPPMRVIYDRVPHRSSDDVLLVMLPGATQKPEELVEHGFVAALRVRSLAITVAMTDAHAGYYLERNLLSRLQSDVIQVAQAEGYRKTWL